jgi:hypothetical protein
MDEWTLYRENQRKFFFSWSTNKSQPRMVLFQSWKRTSHSKSPLRAQLYDVRQTTNIYCTNFRGYAILCLFFLNSHSKIVALQLFAAVQVVSIPKASNKTGAHQNAATQNAFFGLAQK